MPQRQIFCAAYRCGKTQRLVNVVREALEAGTQPGQILALTVHRPAAAALREMMFNLTGLDVPTTTVRQRATAILRAFPEAADLPPGWTEAALLSGIDRRRLIREAWAIAGAGTRSLFTQRGQQPGALDWIALLFDQLSDWSGTADPAHLPDLRIDDEALAELWHAYRAYLRLCRQLGVVAFNEVFTRALDALRAPEIRAANTRQLVLLDDLDLFQPAELLFAQDLIAPTSDVAAAATREPQPDSARALERWLHRWMVRHNLQPMTDEAIRAVAPRLTVGEYATPDAEAHAIARRIVEQIQDGVTPDQLAIVAFDPALVPLLQRTLPQYGVPVQGQNARDGYTLALAPLALAGLKLLAGQALTLAETAALLHHPALGLSSADAHAATEAAEQQRFRPFDPDDSRWPKLSAVGRERLTLVRAVTESSRAADRRPSEQLQYWLAALDLESRSWEQTEAVLDSWAVAIDRQHWTRLLDFLRQAEALDARLGNPLTTHDAIEIIISAQSLIPPEGQPHDQAVAIWRPSALGGCTARTVFIAGLHEGALPQPIQPLPLADDSALTEAFGSLPGFVPPQAHDRAGAWERAHQDLKRTIGRAIDAAHLSYSRTDRQGRTRLLSPLLVAEIGAQIDRHGRLQPLDQSIPMIEIAERATDQALWPRRFSNDALLAIQPPLSGIAPPIESPFRISPTAIEDYFTCPRRCFYARTLRLYDVVSSPRQALGHVVHNALNDLLYESHDGEIAEARALVARHWLPDDYRWTSRLKQTVFRQLAEKAVAQLARYEYERVDRAQFVGGELGFEWTLPGSDVIIGGRIDRIDRSAEGLQVIDYKLGQHSPSINDLLNEFVPPRDERSDTWRPGDIQLPVYALALEQGHVEGLERREDERVVSIALIYPLELYGDSGKLSAKGRREIRLIDHVDDSCAACSAPLERSPKTGTLCRAQLDAVAARVLDAVGRMRAAEWPADPRQGSKTCASCAFRPVCSEPQ